MIEIAIAVVHATIFVGGVVVSNHYATKQLKEDVVDIKKKIYNGLSDKINRADIGVAQNSVAIKSLEHRLEDCRVRCLSE